MQSKAATVKDYLASLPADRRPAIDTLRRVILDNLDKGYKEIMQYGMICYSVPHDIYPHGYHCDPKQPLPFVALASQKNYMSLYLFCSYVADHAGGDEANWFRTAWEATGRKLDMGKSCVRFKKIEDVALDVVGQAIKRMPVKRHIEFYEAALAQSRKAPAASNKPASKKTPAKKPAAKKASARKVAKKANKKAARR
ncbi:MAG: DUF1801 domain-containing protein [Planctomycetes bacterium]|nr:DUF1801 domain-containing protein [Planctomycetota bacterium]